MLYFELTRITWSQMFSISFDSGTRTNYAEKQVTIYLRWYAPFIKVLSTLDGADVEIYQMGAIQFIENLDRTNLTISDEDFEKNVEAAVSAITERHKEHVPQSPRHPRVSDKSALSEPEIVPQSSVEVEYATPRRSTSSRRVIDKSVGSDGENTAVGGLLRTIQRPLSSLGRMFSEEPPTQHSGATSPFPLGPQPSPPRLSPAVFQPPRDSNETRRSHEGIRKSEAGRRQTAGLSADQTARQASTETAEAQRLLRVEHNNVVE